MKKSSILLFIAGALSFSSCTKWLEEKPLSVVTTNQYYTTPEDAEAAVNAIDGAIYRASGFVLTGIKRNTSLWRTPQGKVVSDVGVRTSESLCRVLRTNGSSASLVSAGCERLAGFQLRYVYFIDPTARERLTVPVIPFSAIDAAGARMYRGKPSPCAGTSTRDGTPVAVGGATPTPALP